MTRAGCTGRAARLALTLALALAGAATATAQVGPRSTIPATASPVPASAVGTLRDGTAPLAPPGTAVADDAAPALPDDIQVVRFHGPEGLRVEVLDPAPEPVPPGDGAGLLTVGLKVGQGYRLRLSNLADRPGVELFPTIEVVGHLHRPARIDPGKFPIRVVIEQRDLDEAADLGRLVTRVVYLEDPDQALPLRTERDVPPALDLNPAEEPLKVAPALGRVMAIVRLGLRKPDAQELGTPAGDGLARGGCPFTTVAGARCGLPCGPVVGTPPPGGRAWLPKDEYLCDGGDHGMPIHFGGDGGLRGIDPRDALVLFHDNARPRILPTNTVCLYAPRFASVRASVGANESLVIQHLDMSAKVQGPETGAIRQGPRKFDQTSALEASRHRSRASGLSSRVYAGEHAELRVLSGVDTAAHIGGHTLIQGPDKTRGRAKAVLGKKTIGPNLLNKADTIVMTGIIQGGGQMVMTWTPRELAGVETPPNKPGLSVIKQVDADQAEPGDVVTFTIRFKNMGNTAIRAVSIVDSLMPRLEYVAGSATGPADTIFSAGTNKGGALELRWDLPEALLPNAEGTVSFRAVVR